jgi:tetratricopeptide (TPR) repeat protein
MRLMLKGQPDSSLDYYDRALGMMAADDLSDKAYCLGGMGETYWEMGRLMPSLECFAGSLKILRQTGETYSTDRLLYKMALNYQRLGRFDEALRNLYASLTASRKLNNLIQMGHTYQVAGSIYLQLGEFENALEYHRKGLAIHEQLGDRPGLADALDVLADIYMELERFDEALRMYNHSYELRRRMGDKRMIVKSQMNLGHYYANRGNYPLALSYFRDASALAEELQDKWFLARISVNLGDLYEAKNEHAVALQFLEDGLSVAQDMGSRDIQLDAHHHLYELHRTMGNYRESLEHYLKFATLREDIMKSQALDKGISMQVDVLPDTVVYADSRMFETILRNILSNAVKYTPSGGKVTISVRDQEAYSLFEVQDTGVGMDGDQVANLFKVDRKVSRPGTNN